MRFENPEGDELPGLRGTLRMMLSMRPPRWPRAEPIAPAPRPPERVGEGALRATFVGHATILLQASGLNFLTDPHYSRAAGPFGLLGPRRAHAPGLRFEDLPPIDAVLLSHNHYDHMDLPTLKRLLESGRTSRVLCGLGVSEYFPRHLRRFCVEMKWWDRLDLGEGRAAHFTPVRHFSARGFHDRFRSLWGGFALELPGGNLYFPGDTAWGSHFRETGARLGPFRLACLPVGAYEPRWFMKHVHINPEEAVAAFQELRAERALAYHHSCFRLTSEPKGEPLERLAAELDRLKIDRARFRSLEPGGHWEL